MWKKKFIIKRTKNQRFFVGIFNVEMQQVKVARYSYHAVVEN